MKQVLIIDASPLFREYLKEKLTKENIKVEIAQSRRDAFIKTNSLLPDLIILDVAESFADVTEFLEKKRNDPNARSIPIIVSGPRMDNQKITLLAQFGVIKYFTKPIKFDIFFEAIGFILREQFSIDITQCRIELHLNNNIIFLEIAKGLNREKIALLKYKISELITANKLDDPKMVIMITDIPLSFIDGTNLEFLFESILSEKRLQKKNIKVLSLDDFVTQFVDGHVSLKGIEVVTDLTSVVNSLVDTISADNMQSVINDKVLKADNNIQNGSVEMRFFSDTDTSIAEYLPPDKLPRVAILDSDKETKEQITAELIANNYKFDIYNSGMDFINGLGKYHYSAAILDINMAGLSGFEILKQVRIQQSDLPVIVYSNTTQKEDIVQALSLGAKLYLPKPQPPTVVVKRIKEFVEAASNAQ